MAVKARLAAMKKAKEDKLRADEEAKKRKTVFKKKGNVFMRSDTPPSSRLGSGYATATSNQNNMGASMALAAAAAKVARARARDLTGDGDGGSGGDGCITEVTEVRKDSSGSMDGGRKIWSPSSLTESSVDAEDKPTSLHSISRIPMGITHSTMNHATSSRPRIMKGRRKSHMIKSTFQKSVESQLNSALPTSPSARKASSYVRMCSGSKSPLGRRRSKDLLEVVTEDNENEPATSVAVFADDAITIAPTTLSQVKSVAVGDAEGGSVADKAADEWTGVADIYDDTVAEWYYVDDNNETQGPYDGQTMASWESDGYLVGRVVSCWRFAGGMWIDVQEAVSYFIAVPDTTPEPTTPMALKIGKKEEKADKTAIAPPSSSAKSKKSLVEDAKTSVRSKRVLDLLAQLYLPEDASIETVADLAVRLQADLKAAEMRIKSLAESSDNNALENGKPYSAMLTSSDKMTKAPSSTTATTSSSGINKSQTKDDGKNTSAKINTSISNSSNSSSSSSSSSSSTVNVSDSNSSLNRRMRVSTELIVIHDECGNEIRVHEDGRVRMSSKKVADLSAPAWEPDLGSFDLDQDRIIPLWTALKELMEDSVKEKLMTTDIVKPIDAGDGNEGEDKKEKMKMIEKEKKNTTRSSQMWKIFFRKPGQPLKSYGNLVPSSSASVAKVRDEIVSAEMSQPASLVSRKERAPSTRDSTYGGGELSAFRMRLRGKSKAMQMNRTLRRKSYAMASNMLGVPEGLTMNDIMGGDASSGDRVRSKRKSKPGVVGSRRMSVGSLMVVASAPVQEVPDAVLSAI